MLRTTQDQIMEYGESIPVEIKVMSGYDNLAGIKIKFEVTSGGGTFSSPVTYTGDNGIANTIWTLGDETFIQSIKAYTFNEADELIATRELRAYCYIPNKWIKVTYDINKKVSTISDMIFDLNENFTLMVGENYRVYREGDKYYKWSVVDNPLLVSVKWIHIDGNGVIYAVTNSPQDTEADIIKSTDHGNTWSLCTRPYESLSFNFQISICNDNSIWAYRYDEPVRISEDGGISWHDAGGNLSTTNHADVYRLKDNSLLFQGYNTGLLISRDDGISWETIDTPYTIFRLFVTDDDLIVIACLGKGFMLYTSSDYCKTFDLIGAYQAQSYGSTENFVTRWNNFYYITIEGYGVLKTEDFRNMEFMLNFDLYNFFIDHQGVLMIRTKDFQSMYCLETIEDI